MPCPYFQCEHIVPLRLQSSLMSHIGEKLWGNSPAVCSSCNHPLAANKSGYLAYADHLQIFHPGKFEAELASSKKWPYNSRDKQYGCRGKV